MDSILEPLLAILAIFLPIWLVYGLLVLEERRRKWKHSASHGHFDRDGATAPGKNGAMNQP
jgi:hypothetical protein